MTTETITADAVDYDPVNDRYRVEVPLNGQASMILIEALAAVRRCDPLDLDPLYDAVDVDALDDLFESATDDSIEMTVEVDGFEVSVRSDGVVDISPPVGGE